MKIIPPLLIATAFLLAAPAAPAQSPGASNLVPTIDLGFTGDYLFQPLAGSVPGAQLDHPPHVNARTAMTFPDELAHRGFVGHFHGFALLRADGSIAEIQVVSGNSSRMAALARDYVAGWTFDAPQKNGRPVPTVVSFEFFVTDQRTYGPFFEGQGTAPTKVLAPLAPNGAAQP